MTAIASYRVGFLLLSILLLFNPAGFAAEYIASQESGWPQFRGPHRNGTSPEKGLLQVWPDEGPLLLWSATNMGSGYSSPIVSGNRIYLTGDVGEELHIFALDLQGKLLWKTTNGGAWKSPYPGARSSCAYSSGRIFHMNGHGQAAYFDAGDGRPIWKVDTLREFESRKPTWGVAECLLVDGNHVIVTPGGRKASMAALDTITGKTVWMSEPLPTGNAKIEGPAYASPILVKIFGERHIVGVTARHFFGVNATDGRLRWSFELPTQHEVLASSPVLWGDGVFITGPDGGGGKLLRLTKSGDKISVEEAWTTTLDTCHGGIIVLDGFLYGSWYRSFSGWGCVNLQDGSVPYRDREIAMGSAIYADGRLYCLSQTGTMALVRPSPERWEILSRFQFATERQNAVWAHPVILDGRLYLRHQQTLRCYDIKKN